MIHWFNYNGADSRDYGLFIKSKSAFDKPKRNLDFVPIPGRDGDLIIDNGGYENITVKYSLRLVVDEISWDKQSDFEAYYDRAVTFLAQTANYYKLKDSYNPSYYRKACLMSAIAAKQLDPLIADFDVSFNCKPFKYLYSGDKKMTFTVTQNETQFSFKNPTNTESLPLIRVYSNSEYNPSVETTHIFRINGKEYKIKNISNYVDIDSETMNVYKGNSLKNSNYENANFPKFEKGSNTIKANSGISKFEILPHWRQL